VPICTELVSLERYYEYIAYSFLAFPGLLFQDAGVELLKLVTSSRLAVEMFRDIVRTFQFLSLLAEYLFPTFIYLIIVHYAIFRS
jgi:hypothetical protein